MLILSFFFVGLSTGSVHNNLLQIYLTLSPPFVRQSMFSLLYCRGRYYTCSESTESPDQNTGEEAETSERKKK